MKKKTKTMCKVLSVFLTFLIVVQILPLQVLAESFTDAIAHKEFIEDVGKVIGSYNKLLLIDKDFNWSIINESSGVWKEGCWLSNSYSTESSRNYYDSYNYSSRKSTYDYNKDYKSYYDGYGYDSYSNNDEWLDNYYSNKYEEDKKKYHEIFSGDGNSELKKKL